MPYNIDLKNRLLYYTTYNISKIEKCFSTLVERKNILKRRLMISSCTAEKSNNRDENTDVLWIKLQKNIGEKLTKDFASKAIKTEPSASVVRSVIER